MNRHPSEVLRAYTAGIIDGEGSIQINPSKSKKGSEKSYWSLSVQVSSTARELVYWLHNQWGIGTVTAWSPKSGRQQVAYNWRTYSNQAEFLLCAVLPFLVIKYERARIGIEFRSHVAPHSKGLPRNRLTEEMSEQRQLLAAKMRELNHRGGKARTIDRPMVAR